MDVILIVTQVKLKFDLRIVLGVKTHLTLDLPIGLAWMINVAPRHTHTYKVAARTDRYLEIFFILCCLHSNSIRKAHTNSFLCG